MKPISIKIKPTDRASCDFIVEERLMEGENRFTRSEGPYGHETVDAILGLPGVDEVVIAGDTITVKKDDDREWRELEEPIAYAIQLAIAPQSQMGGVGNSSEIDEDALFDQIEDFFDKEVNPSIASHSGKVELIDIQDRTLIVRMMGGCQGCGMANVTLKQGIEANVTKIWPMIEGIRDVTDHASGTNPYYKSEAK